MLGNPLVAAQLEVSQEGFDSMKLVHPSQTRHLHSSVNVLLILHLNAAVDTASQIAHHAGVA
jgi:hypothetical protein